MPLTELNEAEISDLLTCLELQIASLEKSITTSEKRLSQLQALAEKLGDHTNYLEQKATSPFRGVTPMKKGIDSSVRNAFFLPGEKLISLRIRVISDPFPIGSVVCPDCDGLKYDKQGGDFWADRLNARVYITPCLHCNGFGYVFPEKE